MRPTRCVLSAEAAAWMPIAGLQLTMAQIPPAQSDQDHKPHHPGADAQAHLNSVRALERALRPLHAFLKDDQRKGIDGFRIGPMDMM